MQTSIEFIRAETDYRVEQIRRTYPVRRKRRTRRWLGARDAA